MSDDRPSRAVRQVVDPADRVAEVLFGLIMVLTFTGSLGVAGAGREEVRTMLLGALGCNLAWGIIDGLLYLMGDLAHRSRAVAALRAVRRASDPRAAHQRIAEWLPVPVAAVLEPAEIETLRQRLTRLPDVTPRALRGADWRGALALCLLVFLSTLPVAVPFMLIRDARLALRVSNGVAVAMLFICGIAYGRLVGRAPWVFGVITVAVGLILVALTMALGG
ncbi:MAG TPA: VIT1/CCC1 transporter family protein [Vicinamibacterales bacterium]|nr:VIT1/CCC1 transporter family protein [Vicinamibacterales bacterium]